MKKELGASKDKRSALMLAAAKGNLDMVKLLISYGAPLEQKGSFTLILT